MFPIPGISLQKVDWGVERLGVPETWKTTKGRGVKVLVVDTGAPARKVFGRVRPHADLKGRLVLAECRSFVATECDPLDHNGHSTACCGIVAASDNRFGWVGYAPEASVVTFKVADRSGRVDGTALRLALEAAVAAHPDVVSVSLGMYVGASRLRKPIRELTDMGIPVVCAAGNGGGDGLLYPARFPETIAVGAFDSAGAVADFSARGGALDFAFPGVNVTTTWLNGGYATVSGTSFACPACAGVLALLIAKHREQEKATGRNDCKTVGQMREHLAKYAVKPSDASEEDWGRGIIDVASLIGAERGETMKKV